VILRDGGTLRLRPPTPEDRDAVSTFFQALSERSRYLRFHGVRPLDVEISEQELSPDWEERGVLLGELAEGGELRVVALAEYVRLRDRRRAEAAFVVADAHQGRGIGTRLLEQLAAEADAAGIEVFDADVLTNDGPMLRVFADAGFDSSQVLSGGEVRVELRIARTDAYLARVDARHHRGVEASLRPFFDPRSVGVIGASAKPGSIGGALFRNLVEAGFTGRAVPVNRTGDPVAGVASVRSLSELAEPPDMAVVCVPGPAVLPAVDDVLAAGVKAVCVISAGFAEVGGEGVERQQQLLSKVRAAGARLIGPNCLGLAVPPRHINATFAGAAFPGGVIGFSSQSGALGLTVLEHATSRGLGLSSFVSVGNKADVSSNDLLEYWEDDPTTELVLLYMESLGNPERFGRIARRVSRVKPIVAMKSGTTRQGARAAGSHTAALAGADSAVEALFRQSGVVRVRSLEELLDVAALLSSQPLPRGNRVAMATNAGGLGILCTDACVEAGLEPAEPSEQTKAALHALMPPEGSVENPVDMLGSATADTYRNVVPLLLSDPGVDAVIVLFAPPVVATGAEVAGAVADALTGLDEHTKPVLGVIIGEHPTSPPAGFARFAFPESAARALGRAVGRWRWLSRQAGSTPALGGCDRAAARSIVSRGLGSGNESWLEPRAAWALLEAYGIPTVGQQTAPSVDEAVAASGRLGYPVAVETAAAGVHKSDTGGVAIGLDGPDAVRAAVERIGAPVVVQKMAEPGVEFLIGAVRDPVFGPLIAFGPGGVSAELIDDARFALAPITDVDVAELLGGGAAGKLVRGYRGGPAADTSSLADLLYRLAALAVDIPELAELDLNPVIAGPDVCVAVDARILVRRGGADDRAKTW
jgi:acyl-CoA synthetase (NDP forming)/GNAT superfamily N-acetyltransferase